MSDLRYITKEGERWRVRVPDGVNNRRHVGLFDTVEEAQRARDEAVDADDFAGVLPHDMSGVTNYLRRTRMGSYPSIFNTSATPFNQELHINDPELPQPANLVTEQPLTLILNKWLYCSDIHAPLHSVEMLRRLIAVGRSQRVEHLVIGGDLFDFDSISAHPKTERTAGIRDTLRITGEILKALGNEFHLYLLPGNHDARLAKKLNDDWPFSGLVYAALNGRAIKRELHITDYDYIYVQGSRRKWVVGHPRFYSRTPAKGVADVAQLHQMSVIGAHNHVQGVMWSADGKHLAIDPGAMCEATLTPYQMKGAGLSKYPTWRKGFVLIDNDIPTLCADGLIDWRSYGAN